MSSLELRRLKSEVEAKQCANLMACSEPWITLGRTFEDSLKILLDSSKEIYLAFLDNQHAGFIIINMKGAFIGYIQTICISPEFRGKGLGTKLIQFAEERIFSETPNVFMCVSSFNKEAQKLYERLGYEVIGELKDYIVSGYSEILLRKTIAPLKNYEPQRHKEIK